MKISWTHYMENKVLHAVKGKYILHTVKRRKANCTAHISRKNCLLTHVIEGNVDGGIEVTGKRGIRCKQLLGNL